jgi:hypothetical protein
MRAYPVGSRDDGQRRVTVMFDIPNRPQAARR